MTYAEHVSPTRQYEITMATHDKKDVITELVTLPETLVNNKATAQVYWNKYVPEGYAMVDAQPFVEGEDAKPTWTDNDADHTGFGDELDYVGSEEDPDGFSVAEVDDED